ncbi:DNA mismatch repair protein MSH3 [Alternaria rosae]|uniref:DNA mismatch repair protein MSH3 n=1 Tax=Alternaria rosae TaxID=1187941 RepID=UPI001E8ED88B|nr:DNA mismatch repair protein MSH3 [Alternaria rosae]KAH6839669.1 DNA mismatch repair protein MSH3 [Alternaria rosae]
MTHTKKKTTTTTKMTLPVSQSIPVRKRAIDEDDGAHDSGRSSPSKRVRFEKRRLAPTNACTKARENPPIGRPSFYSLRHPLHGGKRNPEEDDDEDAAASQKQKERLHEKFVKKLGRPDSFAELRRRNKIISEDNPNANGEEGDGDEEDEDEPPQKPAKGRRALRQEGKQADADGDTILGHQAESIWIPSSSWRLVTVQFFGEDARTASKELGIVCIPDTTSTLPSPPRPIRVRQLPHASTGKSHVKRLVQANHKVGVVRQLETAALKAAGTYVDDVEGLEAPTEGSGASVQSTGYLLCITESNAKGWGTDEKVQVGLVAVQPATGDIIYDDFEDGFMRSEIETRLLHIAPAEFLVVGDMSKATDKLIQHLSASKTNVFGDRSRVERVEKPKTMAAQAYSHISNFYAGKMKSSQEADSEKQGAVLDKVHQLSEHVTICLSAMITYLSEYGLEHVFDLTKYFQPFSARSYMLLNGNTLSSLEIYQNQTDYTSKGSLFWTMNRTKTRFGQRLLRKWVGRPLIDKERLEERIAAVEELKEGENTIPVDKLKFVLGKIRTDLEKVLIRIYYKKCTRPELLAALQSLQEISSQYLSAKTPEQSGFSSSLLSEAVSNVPKIYDDLNSFLERINAKAAKDDDKYSFFREEHEAEDINDLKLSIASVEDDLNTHRKDAAAKLGKSKVDFVTVAGIEYLIEVKRKAPEEKKVPASWQQISATKTTLRFHTPEVKRMLQERDQYKESLAAACDKAYIALLEEISSKYQQLRDCVASLATLDALLSLATLASQPGYVKPTFTDDIGLNIAGGRHPMVEQILLENYVPNDLSLSHDSTRALLITGPNMGGKSSYVRSAALIAIMGQIGSYVPANEARLGMLDAVFTRMGAFDNMLKGESTFMVELNETSDILKSATPRSLIILDELGRGTSTFDGVAIAEAVLDYVIRDLQSLTLFITHYQHLAKLSSRFSNGELKNVHMRFEEQNGGKEVVSCTKLPKVLVTDLTA